MDMKSRKYDMGARQQAKTATRDAIIKAAIDTFMAERSFAITLPAVAERADVTVKTVLRHFGSRDALVDAAWSQACEDVMAERTPPSDDPDAALKVLIAHYERMGDVVLVMLAEEKRPARSPDEHRGPARTSRLGGGSLRGPASRATRRAFPADRCPRRRHRRLQLEASATRPWAVCRRRPRPDAAHVRSDSGRSRNAFRRSGRGGAMKILFVIVDGGGNIPPQLAVARALQARGVEVHVLGHSGIRERVEAAGLAFEPFTDGRHFDPTIQRSLAAIMADFARVAADRRLGQCVVEAARRHRVDAVVVDMILVGGIPEIVDVRHPDGRLRALLLSSGSGHGRGSARLVSSAARHRSAWGRTARRRCRSSPPVRISTRCAARRSCAIPAWSGRACRAPRCQRRCRESWSV